MPSEPTRAKKWQLAVTLKLILAYPVKKHLQPVFLCTIASNRDRNNANMNKGDLSRLCAHILQHITASAMNGNGKELYIKFDFPFLVEVDELEVRLCLRHVCKSKHSGVL